MDSAHGNVIPGELGNTTAFNAAESRVEASTDQCCGFSESIERYHRSVDVRDGQSDIVVKYCADFIRMVREEIGDSAIRIGVADAELRQKYVQWFGVEDVFVRPSMDGLLSPPHDLLA